MYIHSFNHLILNIYSLLTPHPHYSTLHTSHFPLRTSHYSLIYTNPPTSSLPPLKNILQLRILPRHLALRNPISYLPVFMVKHPILLTRDIALAL